MNDVALEALRGEIDRIDESMHDLLIRRAEVVAAISEAKRGTADAVMRPGREAVVLRRLLARHRGPLPRGVVARIWREMISAMIRLQGPFSVAVCAPERSVGYWDLARAHYGSTTPMTLHRSPFNVLRAVRDKAGAVGIIPLPQEEDPQPWWASLTSRSEPRLRVIAKLPFTDLGEGRFEGLSALAIGTCEPEPTGDDVSLLVIGGRSETSRARVNEHIKAAGLPGHCISAAAREEGDGTGALHLVEVTGFVQSDDPRLAGLLEQDEEAISQVACIGAYAVPFDS